MCNGCLFDFFFIISRASSVTGLFQAIAHQNDTVLTQHNTNNIKNKKREDDLITHRPNWICVRSEQP